MNYISTKSAKYPHSVQFRFIYRPTASGSLGITIVNLRRWSGDSIQTANATRFFYLPTLRTHKIQMLKNLKVYYTVYTIHVWCSYSFVQFYSQTAHGSVHDHVDVKKMCLAGWCRLYRCKINKYTTQSLVVNKSRTY